MKKEETSSQVESARRLKEIAQKKFNTTMIFPIAEFEKSFSHIWGADKDISTLTKEEYAYRAIWQRIRSEILDNGNKQSRAFSKELDAHTVEFKGYTIQLLPQSRRTEGN